MNVDISLSTWALKDAAIGKSESAICRYVCVLVLPSESVIAVRYARPGLLGGSAAEPAVNTMRNATSGELVGSAITRICAAAGQANSTRHARRFTCLVAWLLTRPLI